jgi:hypothetical protein
MARIATVVRMPPPFRRRTTKKEEPRRSPRSAVTLEEHIEEIMDRMQQAGDNQVSDKRSALDALSAPEKAAVLDELLAARPDLRLPAEAYAAQVMSGADQAPTGRLSPTM